MKEFNHFLKGFGSVLNLFPSTTEKTLVGNKPDPFIYVQKSWRITGQHMYSAMNQVKAEKQWQTK